MLIPLAVFEQRFYAVVIQPGLESHVHRFDLDVPAPWLLIKMKQCQPQQIVQSVTKGTPTRNALALYAFQNILIERDGRPDAHDVKMIASQASEWQSYYCTEASVTLKAG